jgi:S1-C subfamily serine protease
VLSFDGEALSGVDALHKQLTAGRAGKQIPIRLLRRGKLIDASVTPQSEDVRTAAAAAS